MKILAPHAIQSPSSIHNTLNGADPLRFAFGHEDDRSVAGGPSRRLGQFRHDMDGARVMECVDRVQPKAVQMKFLDPITSVLNEELAAP